MSVVQKPCIGFMVVCCPEQELKLLTEQHEQRMQQAQQAQQQAAGAMQSGALQATLLDQDSSLADQALAMLPGAIAGTVPSGNIPLSNSGTFRGFGWKQRVLCSTPGPLASPCNSFLANLNLLLLLLQPNKLSGNH